MILLLYIFLYCNADNILNNLYLSYYSATIIKKMDKMDKMGYIYLRDNAWYRSENTIKLGIASNIKDRAGTYITGEIIRGEFIKVFQVQHENMRLIESHLHKVLWNFHDSRDGGTEFFNRQIIEIVANNIPVPFREMSREECLQIDREARHNNYHAESMTENSDTGTLVDDDDESDTDTLIDDTETLIDDFDAVTLGDDKEMEETFEPREFQKEIIEKCATHYSSFNKGLLILTCGVGKTLISLWVAQRLGSNKIAIGVPTTVLLEQWLKVIAQIFPDRPVLKVPCNQDVATFVANNPKCVVITTYSSSYKLIGAVFDLKILDEAHHLTSINLEASSSRAFVRILDVESSKQLALTATPKQLEGNNDPNIISNDNRQQFGEVIHRLNLLWAIENNVVCDYVIQTIVVDEGKINDSIENKRLFLAAYCALKSMVNKNMPSHHLLIYCNDMYNSAVILGYLKALLRNQFSELADDCFAETYNSNMAPLQQREILDRFESARLGIIICVYCLGEGWNCPLLDAVVFAENMSSNIRITQCAQRACRKNYFDPCKIAKTILPILDMDEDDKQDLKTVREVIYQMGLEDASVISKMSVYRDAPDEEVPNKPPGSNPTMEFVYDEEITRRLRLKTTPRTTIGFEAIRKMLADRNIRSIEQYNDLCECDIRFPRDPEKTFGHLVARWSWVYYFGIQSTFYAIDVCRQKCIDYLEERSDIRTKVLDISVVCEELCKIDAMFPPLGMWVDYYGVNDLSDIIPIFKPLAKKKGIFS
jgi:superfamily II DNA or RNA helicase